MKPLKLPRLSVEETQELLPDGIILAGYRGSKAHNTWVAPTDPNSVDDIDIMAIFVPPLNYYFGLAGMSKRQRGTKEKMLELNGVTWDSVSYELKKYVHLLLNSNPNVLSLLWIRENLYFKVTEIGQELIDNRDIFVSKQAYNSFVGYANSQLKRMENFACKGVMGDKRRRLVEKHGYDTKNASHLIRLLRMGVEFLTDGVLHIHRHDAHELKAIKRGEWSLEKIKAESDKWFELSHEAYVRSPLPAQPDREKAEKLVIKWIKQFHNLR
jgi:predicted nucleotidyltransferase